MPKRIQLEKHLSQEALYTRYRENDDPIERARFQALWLLGGGMGRKDVARTMGYSAEWVRRVAARYNAEGEKGVLDGRHDNPGQAPLLSAEQKKELEAALEGSFCDGTPWSGPKVAQWMSEKLGREVAPQRGWDYLRRAGWTPQRPRPQHKGASAEAQACFPAGAAQGA